MIKNGVGGKCDISLFVSNAEHTTDLFSVDRKVGKGADKTFGRKMVEKIWGLGAGLSASTRLLNSVLKASQNISLLLRGSTESLRSSALGIRKPTTVDSLSKALEARSIYANKMVEAIYKNAKSKGELPNDVTYEQYNMLIQKEYGRNTGNIPKAVKDGIAMYKSMLKPFLKRLVEALKKPIDDIDTFMPTEFSDKVWSDAGRQFFKERGMEAAWFEIKDRASSYAGSEKRGDYLDAMTFLKTKGYDIKMHELNSAGLLDTDLPKVMDYFFKSNSLEIAYKDTFGTNDRGDILAQLQKKITDEFEVKRKTYDKELVDGAITTDEFNKQVAKLEVYHRSDLEDTKVLMEMLDNSRTTVRDPNNPVYNSLAALSNILLAPIMTALPFLQIADTVTVVIARIVEMPKGELENLRLFVEGNKDEAAFMGLANMQYQTKLRDEGAEFVGGAPKGRLRMFNEYTEKYLKKSTQLTGSMIQDDWNSSNAYAVNLQYLSRIIEGKKQGLKIEKVDLEKLLDMGFEEADLPELQRRFEKYRTNVNNRGDTFTLNIQRWEQDKFTDRFVANIMTANRRMKPMASNADSPTWTSGSPEMSIFTRLTKFMFGTYVQKGGPRMRDSSAQALAFYMSAELAATMVGVALKLAATGNGHLVTDDPEKFMYISIMTSGILGLGSNYSDVLGSMLNQNASAGLFKSLFPQVGALEQLMGVGRIASGSFSARDVDGVMKHMPGMNALGIMTIPRKFLSEEIYSGLSGKNGELYINESKPQPKEK